LGKRLSANAAAELVGRVCADTFFKTSIAWVGIMKEFIERLATNNWINLVIALVCVITGISDIVATANDVSQEGVRLRAGHGLATLGVWQATQAIGAILSSLDYASKAADR
jgi:hypothetical protein